MEQMENKAQAVARNPKNPIIRRQLVTVHTPALALEPEGYDAVHLLAVCQHVPSAGVTLKKCGYE